MESLRDSVFKELTKKINEIERTPVLINLPSGLSKYAIEISNLLRNKGIENYIYADETFGGCDLPIQEAKQLKCETILNFSHTEFIKGKDIEGIRIIYVPVFIEYDVITAVNAIKENITKRGFSTISLHAHLQYTHKLKEIAENLEKHGVKVVLVKSPLERFEGQILGCETSSTYLANTKGAEVIVYIGDGVFHYYALLKDSPSNMPLLVYNPLTNETKFFSIKDKEKIMRQYYIKYGQIKSSKRLGIVLTSKIGQYLRFGRNFNKIINEFKSQGKEVYILIANKIDPNQLESFSSNIEAFINLACPRIEDDAHLYSKPIMSYTTYKKIESEINGTSRTNKKSR